MLTHAFQILIVGIVATVNAQDASIDSLQNLVRVESLLSNALSSFANNNENPSLDTTNTNQPRQASLPAPSNPDARFSIFGSQNRFSNLPNNDENTKKVARSPQSILSGLGLDAIGSSLGSSLSDLILGPYKDAVNRRPSPPGTNLATVQQFLRSRASKPDPAYKSIGTKNKFTDAIDDIDSNSRNPVNGISRFLSLFDGL